MGVLVRAGHTLAAALAIVLSGAGALDAQEAEPPGLAELETPVSPAFVILGIAPTTVSRPSTPEALAFGILAASKDSSILPRNYALEFSPYWLKSRPGLTFEEWYRPSLGQSMRQTFTVSLATTRGSRADSTTTFVGLGFRVVPLVGRPAGNADSLVAAIRRRQRNIADVYVRLVAADPAEQPAIKTELDALQEDQETDAAAFDRADKERVGARWEVAAATVGRFPEHAFDDADVSRLGLWTTFAYRSKTSIDAALMVRWQRDLVGEEENIADLGGRLSLLVGDLSLDVEGVRRWIFDVTTESPENGTTRGTFEFESTYRLVGSAEYRIDDRLSVSTTFGTDHREPEGPRHPLVALLGLDLEFGYDPPVRP